MSPHVRAPRRPSFWKLPLLLFALGLAITSVFAVQQEVAATQRTSDRFNAEVDTIERLISDKISQRINEFNVGLDFLSSSGRIDADQLTAFLNRRSEHRSSPIEGDPGFVISETVDDLEAFVAREEADGREINIFSPLPRPDGVHVIITHLERDVPLLGRSFLGFDVAGFEGLLQPDEFDPESDGVYAHVTPLSELFGAFRMTGSSSPGGANSEDAVIYLVAPYRTSDESVSGYVTRLESVSDIVGEVRDQIPQGFRLSASLDGGDPIIEVDARTTVDEAHAASLAIAGSSRAELIDLDPLQIKLFASSEIHDAGRGFSNPRLWAIGIPGALLFAMIAFMRAHNARRLADASIELEIAQTMATTDTLTGLLNRQGLFDVLEHPVSRPGVLLFIDIDNFKAVNDEDGHEAGDRVLQRFGSDLRTMVRTDDVLCRLGGDEFLVFLSNPIEETRVEELVSMIRTSIRTIDARTTCSIGISARTIENLLPIEVLLHKADAAMYADKRAKQRAHRISR